MLKVNIRFSKTKTFGDKKNIFRKEEIKEAILTMKKKMFPKKEKKKN